MDLREFVRDALLQIVEGVHDAQQQASGSAIINPRLAEKWMKDEKGGGYAQIDPENLHGANLIATNSGTFADVVDFDIAITVESTGKESTEEGKAGEGGLKLHVLSAGVNLSSKKGSSNENTQGQVSRIKFRVPVQFSIPP
jgi:hypothetical protein